MLFYRVLRAVHRGYPLTVFWVYVGLFALALPLMFIFPPGTLILLGFSLASLVGVMVIAWLLRSVLHLTARLKLHAGVCPECSERSERASDAVAAWQCERCGTVFLPSGAEIVAPGT